MPKQNGDDLNYTVIRETRQFSIAEAESEIDIDFPVYLMTWCPDPSQMPDAKFGIQHQYNLPTIISFLRGCKCGMFCVEPTQLGNPHYHGWYQVSDDPLLTKLRLRSIKVLQRLGRVQINKAANIKINNYKKRGNSLYYYKKECLTACLLYEPNPITKDTHAEPVTDVHLLMWPDVKDRRTSAKRASAKQEIIEFYQSESDSD